MVSPDRPRTDGGRTAAVREHPYTYPFVQAIQFYSWPEQRDYGDGAWYDQFPFGVGVGVGGGTLMLEWWRAIRLGLYVPSSTPDAIHTDRLC